LQIESVMLAIRIVMEVDTGPPIRARNTSKGEVPVNTSRVRKG